MGLREICTIKDSSFGQVATVLLGHDTLGYWLGIRERPHAFQENGLGQALLTRGQLLDLVERIREELGE